MDNNNYTSSRITTFQKKKWKYGYFEIKAMFDKKQGTWPAIWLLSETIIEEGWPQCGEIDIMKHINVEDQIYGSLHSKEYNHMKGNNLGDSHSVNNVEDFNIYGLEWQLQQHGLQAHGLYLYHLSMVLFKLLFFRRQLAT